MSVDIVGPLVPITNKGNRYILTLVVYATRYPEAVANNENKNILVIKRTKGRRSYSGHDLLLIQLDTVSKHVRIFEGNSTLEDHIQLSDRANVVIGLYGANFSNLVFCKPKHSLLK